MDVKSANILLKGYNDNTTQVYLLDFGLVSDVSATTYEPNPKLMHNGTTEYASRDAVRDLELDSRIELT